MKAKKLFSILILFFLFSCSNIKESRIKDLENQVRELQKNNVRLMNKTETLERRMYLINLMQDKIENLSLQIDELKREKATTKLSSKKSYVKKVKKEKRINNNQFREQEPSYIYVEKKVKEQAKQNVISIGSQNDNEENSEEPIPLNPKLDLRGVIATSPQNIYRKAMEYLKNKDYDRASALFLFIIQQFPDDDLADNSMYWTGECYYATHNYNDAIKYFNNVIKKYPDGNKVPDSILKIGLSYMKMEKYDIAKDFFNKVIKKYPWSSPAKIAKEKINELNSGVKQ